MCTVTVLQGDGKIYITSNRDEDVQRNVQSAPCTEIFNGIAVTYPRDPKAGGTWFAVSESGNVLVLLNGAFVKHEHTPPYRLSRGLIVLELAAAIQPIKHFQEIALEQIEPFTLIIFHSHRLYELRWDGSAKHIHLPDIHLPHIYSSATLYSTEARLLREKRFETFLQKTKTVNEQNIIRFHSSHYDDMHNGFVMQRHDWLKTLSITQAVLSVNNIDLKHYDLMNHKTYRQQISLKNNVSM